MPQAASSRWHQIEAEPDPRTKLRRLSRLHREICVREAPVFAIMADAAGSDPEIRTLMHEMADRRYKDHHRLAKNLQQTGYLRPDLPSRRAADIIGALANEETYLTLVRDRQWPTQDYEHWLADQLIAALLP